MMTTQTLILAMILIAAAACLQAMVGFGFALAVMAFLPFLIDYTQSLVITQAIGLISTAAVAIRYRKKIRYDILMPLLAPSLVLSLIFSIVSVKAPGRVLFIMLGVVLIILSVWFLGFSDRIHIRPTRRNGLIAGVLCGIGSGLFAVSGPQAAVYLLEVVDDKEEYRATIQAFFAITNIVCVSVRCLMGVLPLSGFKLIAGGVIAMIPGLLLGFALFGRINGGLLKKLVYITIGVNGVWIVLSRLTGLY